MEPLLDAAEETKKTPPVVLTIAGFDPSNGAGVTADLQVFAAHGLFGTAAITALTVQSTLGVAAVEAVSGKTLRATLDHLVADLPPVGIKIGMLGSAEVVEVVADFLLALSDVEPAQKPLVVLDPVIRASSGMDLLPKQAIDLLLSRLLPLVSWITPNMLELEYLTADKKISCREAVQVLGEQFPSLRIVATGGDEAGPPIDYLRLPSGEVQRFDGERVDTTFNHGTGCAFSSALLSQLVLGRPAGEAVARAKAYVEGGLRFAPGVGHGAGRLTCCGRCVAARL